MPGLGEYIQEHPAVVVGGAVGVGLLLFTLSSAKPAAVSTADANLVPVAQAKPDPAVLTVDQYNSAMGQYDEAIRAYIASLVGQGHNPPPNPMPLPPPGPGDCGPGYHLEGGPESPCVPD